MTAVDFSLAFVTGHPRPMALLDAGGRVVVHSRGWIRQEGPIPDLVGTPAPRGEQLLGALERSSHPDASRVDRMIREVLSGGTPTLQAEIRARCGPDDDRCVVVLTALRLDGERAACLEFLPPTPPRVDPDSGAGTPFKEVVETLGSVVFVTSPAGAGGYRVVHYVSPAYEQVWGRRRSLLRDEPLSFLDTIHPDDRDDVASNLWREAEGTWDREFRIVRPEGTVRWIHSRAFPVRNTRGEVTRVVTLATDVTPRRELTEALRRAREELDQMVDRAPVALVLHQRGQVLKANRVAARYLGEDHPAAVTRIDLMERIHPDDRAFSDPPEGTGPRPGDRVVRIRSEEGEWVGYRTASTRIRHPSGRPVSLLALWGPHAPALPVAARGSEGDDALSDTRLFEEAPLGLALLDAEGRLVEANARLAGLLGWNEGPSPTGPLADLLPAALRRRGRAAVRALAGGRIGSIRADVEVAHASGHRVPLGLHVAAVGDDEPRLLVAAEDLAPRRAEEERRRREERIDALGRLAGGIAHDFNNLMTVVTGHAELVLDELAHDGPAADDVREIRSAGLRAASLTDELLTFSRRRGGEPVPLDLGRVLREMEPGLRDRLPNGIRLVIDPTPGTPRVEADPALMRRLVDGLVDNARDAMPEGGDLVVSVREHRDGSVALVVTDTGEGMGRDVVRHIFEPFFTTRPPGHGTGLGLALVHGIVEERGGRIEVESVPDEGTTMRVLLPRFRTEGGGARSRERPAEPTVAPREPRASAEPATLPEAPVSPWSPPARQSPTLLPAHILLVEDEDSVARLGTRILERRGYRVQPAATGAEAVARLTAGGALPDLVVADARLRDLDASTFVSAVRTVSDTLPVLLLSAFDPRDDRIPHGPGVSLLQKPFNAEELSTAVRRALRAGRRGRDGYPAGP